MFIDVRAAGPRTGGRRSVKGRLRLRRGRDPLLDARGAWVAGVRLHDLSGVRNREARAGERELSLYLPHHQDTE